MNLSRVAPANDNRFDVPSFVDDGQPIIAPLGDGTGRGIRGVVTCAAGRHARVKTTLWERWFPLYDLRTELR